MQVTEITIRQPSSEKLLIVDEEDVESVTVADADEELEEVGRDDLRSITQAILQGKNLRTNSFVQECEKQGFYFLSMTFELANTKTPEVIQVSIRFKLSPQMFEVVLTNMAERTDIGERLTTFSAARQQEILKEFWNISHKIWRQLYETLPDPERQLSFASIDRTTP